MPRAATIRSGAEWLMHPAGMLGLLATVAAVIALGAKVGLAKAATLGVGLYALPVVALAIRFPVVVIYVLVALCFTANGLARYVDAPFGMMVDGLLVLGWVATLLRRFPRNWDTPGDPRAWPELREDGFVLSLLWFGYIVFELGNPAAQSRVAWAYAMRSMGFYQVLTVGLAYFHLRDSRHLKHVLHLFLALSVLGALWGIRQKYFWLDAAEEHWLFAEEHATQHILFGELRTFSFYSDAGQFGASQAMAFLMAGILAVGAPSWRHRAAYAVAFALCFVGFGISGTRGALAVPAAGGMVYLLVSRNTRIFVLGALVMAMSYGVLRYTSLGHGVKQVQRMRTALDPNEPSLLVRLRNQELLSHHLAAKPLGAGVGSSGFWGNRFSPNTIFAQTATDSYYVRLWVETGVVGLALHLFMLGYFLGCGGARVWHTLDPVLRHRRAAMLCGFAGMLLASYGNQVFNQFPTALMVALAVPVLCGGHWRPERGGDAGAAER